jgi:hypothetical protein
MSVSRFALALVAASALAAPVAVHAAADDAPTPFTSLQPWSGNAPATAKADTGFSGALRQIVGQDEGPQTPQFLDDAAPPPAESPNIHGFFSSPFKTAYVTPRGLVVQNEGVVWQPVVGLVFPIGDLGALKHFTVVGGIWNSVDSVEHDARVGPWDEMDAFVSFSGTVADVISLNFTYSPWSFPQSGGPKTEHNVDFKVGYDDSKLWGTSGFALNPYVDFFYNISGGSTVVLGRTGGAYYVEPGIAPSFTFKAMPQYPVTLTLPIYTHVGESTYWDAHHTFGHSAFGLISASANLSVPLSFIPARYGHWHGDLGVTYDYLINNALLHAGTILSGNTNHNVIVGSLGVGVNF